MKSIVVIVANKGEGVAQYEGTNSLKGVNELEGINRMKFCSLVLIFVFSLFFLSCQSTPSQSRYPITSSGMAKQLEGGTIVDLREVVIDGTSSGLGAYGGAIGAIVAGRAIGAEASGTSLGAAVGAAGGMIAGGVVGPKIEKALTSTRAQELTIRMDEGGTIIVVQEIREPRFNIGDSVRVDSTLAGAARVFHADDNPHIDPDTGAYLPDDFESL